jgi:hypothetical protein
VQRAECLTLYHRLLGGAGGGERGGAVFRHHRVHGRVHRVDTAMAGLQKFDRRDFLGGDTPAQLDG